MDGLLIKPWQPRCCCTLVFCVDTDLLLLGKADHPVMNEQLLLHPHEADQKGLIPLHKSVTQAWQALKATHASDINPRMGIFEEPLLPGDCNPVLYLWYAGCYLTCWGMSPTSGPPGCCPGLPMRCATHNSSVDNDQEHIFLTKRVECLFIIRHS